VTGLRRWVESKTALKEFVDATRYMNWRTYPRSWDGVRMSGPLVECVPNFSEGADARRVEAIVAAMHVEGVRLLDWSMDADHNRSVVTIAGPPAAVVEAAVRGAGKAAELIDLTRGFTRASVQPT
jgi:hypothetical protein